MKSDIRDIVNDGVGDPHADSHDVAESWVNWIPALAGRGWSVEGLRHRHGIIL